MSSCGPGSSRKHHATNSDTMFLGQFWTHRVRSPLGLYHRLRHPFRHGHPVCGPLLRLLSICFVVLTIEDHFNVSQHVVFGHLIMYFIINLYKINHEFKPNPYLRKNLYSQLWVRIKIMSNYHMWSLFSHSS